MANNLFPIVLRGAVQTVADATGAWNGKTSFIGVTEASGDGYTFELEENTAEGLRQGTIVTITKTDGNTNAVTVDPQEGNAASVVLDAINESVTYMYVGDSWQIFSSYSAANTTFTGGTIANGIVVTAGDFEATDGTLKVADGGAVSQGTDRSTAVASNTHAGVITVDGTALADGASATFQVNCDEIVAEDVVILNHASGGTAGDIEYFVSAVGAGSFKITYKNVSGAESEDQYVFNYAIIKGSAS